MAFVYKAHDPVLGRTVALKLLRGEDPDLAERLLREARAQARIDHEHVCRIYEAGREDSRPYIAMQYVDGSNLKDLASSLTLEQKLKLMREVAEAVHAAHREGVVHRDLKPSNVMAERTEDGDWFPYVLDFGLARDAAAPGLTMTGVALGTPWYMSPEQARGETRTLDRRSDVYSLGATLYELVGGQPPFHDASGVGVLVRVLNEEPAPLSSREAAVPADVQTIITKCLEKEPGRRYESARALADDLGRYLDGEPIAARPVSIVYRLRRRARKHRVAMTTAAVASLVALAFAGLGLRARATARGQAALAAEFARDVRDVEWLLRVAHMAPLHDIRPERAQVRQHLARIAERMQAEGSRARGPGEYALGRGQLALGDPAAASVHLERAWQAGWRNADVAYALGLALGQVYRRELELADSLGGAESRAARRAEIQRAYRDPAVAYLRQSAGSDVVAPEYVEGLLDFYERRHHEAMASARKALARVPWLYEAALLEGDVQARLSKERHETGDAAGSRLALAAAEESYRAAAATARSDPAAWDGLCQVGIQRMESTLYARGDLAPDYAAARDHCEQALRADPDLPQVHAKLANIHRYWADDLAQRGKNPLAALDQATAEAERAIALDPRNRRAHGNLGIVYRLRAAYEQQHGQPFVGSLGRALEHLQKAVELSGGDAGSLNDLGNVYLTRGLAGTSRGGDPRDDLGQAIAHYDRALQHTPDFAYAVSNRGAASLEIARYQTDHGLDADPTLAEARQFQERAVALLPGLEGTHFRLAEVHALAAELALLRGQDPGPALLAARGELREMARINPDGAPDVSLLAGDLDLTEARGRLEGGLSPLSALASAQRRFSEAAWGNPTLADAWRLRAEAVLVEVRWRMARGQDAGPTLARVGRDLEGAAKRDRRDALVLTVMAEQRQARVDWRHSRGQAAGPDLDEGLALADRALALNASLARAMAVRASLLRARAEETPGAVLKQARAREAEAALARALEANAHLARSLRPESERLRRLLGG